MNDKSVLRKVMSKSNMKKHTGEKSFFCSLCDKAFLNQNDLQGHAMTHNGEKPNN